MSKEKEKSGLTSSSGGTGEDKEGNEEDRAKLQGLEEESEERRRS